MNTNTLETSGNTPSKEWLRVKEATAFCGISKPGLYDLMKRGFIKNTSLKGRGQLKGTRLINFDSLRSFLNGKATGGDQPQEQASALN